MAEWFRAPAIPPRVVGGAGSVPDKVGFEIDSFFDLFFSHCALLVSGELCFTSEKEAHYRSSFIDDSSQSFKLSLRKISISYEMEYQGESLNFI